MKLRQGLVRMTLYDYDTICMTDDFFAAHIDIYCEAFFNRNLNI